MEISVHKFPYTVLSQALGCFMLVVNTAMMITAAVDLLAGNDLDATHLVFLFVPALFGCRLVMALIHYPTIKLYQNGLKVRAFIFFWIWVPWNNMLGLEDLLHHHGGILVQARGLSVFHRLISLSCGAGIKPGFYISDNLTGYEALAQVVRDKWDEILEERYR